MFKNNSIEMNQTKYIEKIVAKFGIQDNKPRSMPCEMDINILDKSNAEPQTGNITEK